MNTIFNISRFVNYAKRSFLMSKNQTLLFLGIIAGVYILGLLLYWLLGTSLFYLIQILTVLTIITGPCFLESNISRYNGVMEFTFPVSTFERFLLFWLKYAVLLPLSFFCIYYSFSFIFSAFGIEAVSKYAGFFLSKTITFKMIMILLGAQSVFFVGYLSFNRMSFIKTLGLTLLIMISSIVLMKLMTPDFTQTSQADFAEWMAENTGKNLSETMDLVKDISSNIGHVIFPFGLWLVGFFKFREKEI